MEEAPSTKRAFLAALGRTSSQAGPSAGLEEDSQERSSATREKPADGLTWFADLIERAAEKASTVPVSRRRFIEVSTQAAKAVGASALLPNLEAALRTGAVEATVAVPADVVTDVWVGYLTPERLEWLETLNMLRGLDVASDPLALAALANDDPAYLPRYGASQGFRFLERAQRLTPRGSQGFLRPDPKELQCLADFFDDAANFSRFSAHPAVQASCGPDVESQRLIFGEMKDLARVAASLSPEDQMIAQLAANPPTTHFAWRVRRVLDGDTAFLERDPWFQAEHAYWEGWHARQEAMALAQDTEARQKAEADFNEWEWRRQVEQQQADALAQRLAGPFTAAPGDGLPTRDTVAADVATALIQTPARYGVFTAALDRLGPAVDAQALAMVYGRLLLAWTEPTQTAQADVAHRLAALLTALEPDERTHRRMQLFDNMHDLINAISAITGAIEHIPASSTEGVPRPFSGQRQALTSERFKPVRDRWRRAVEDHDVMGVFEHGTVLASQYHGALRRIQEGLSSWPSAGAAHAPASANAMHDPLTYLHLAVPRAVVLSDVALDDLAGAPHLAAPLEFARLAQDLAPWWHREAGGYRIPLTTTVLATPSPARGHGPR